MNSCLWLLWSCHYTLFKNRGNPGLHEKIHYYSHRPEPKKDLNMSYVLTFFFFSLGKYLKASKFNGHQTHNLNQCFGDPVLVFLHQHKAVIYCSRLWLVASLQLWQWLNVKFFFHVGGFFPFSLLRNHNYWSRNKQTLKQEVKMATCRYSGSSLSVP